MVSLLQPQTKKSDPNSIFINTARAQDDSSRWQIELNASLELRDVLNCFFNGIQRVVPCASIQYLNTSNHIRVDLGAIKVHSAKYTLKAQGYSLGEIVFTRSTRFSQADLQQLEESLTLLFYPLRNAMLYKEALDNSLKDGLTHIANRAAFELAIKRELGMAKRHNQPLTLVMIDIDYFKKVNDTYGHHAGDCLLSNTAKILKSTLRETDQVFRFGGEEFVILLANANIAAGFKVAERARKAIAKSEITAGTQKIKATASMGVSTFSVEDTRDRLFNRADEALYLAKKAGRNTTKTEWDLSIKQMINSAT